MPLAFGLYCLVGAIVYGVVLWQRPRMRAALLEYDIPTRIGFSALGVLAWWVVLFYAIVRHEDQKIGGKSNEGKGS